MTTDHTDPTSYLVATTHRPRAPMLRGAGSWLWDTDGNEYLDFLQGWAVNALGHCPAEIAAALSQQSQLLLTPSPAFHNVPQLELAAQLCRLSTLTHAVFTNSGAEANEAAVKLARKFGRVRRGGAYEVITTTGAFHGRTLAMMSATGKPAFHSMFPPNMPGFRHVPYGDAQAVADAIGTQTVAVMVEPIQGEGGVVVPPRGYLERLREITRATGTLLILDEIQTGIGRTGRLFAHQWEDARPDILTLGKGLGSGVPLAATLVDRDANCLEPGEHGSTYGGNPLSCAVGHAVVSTVAEPPFLQRVMESGELLRQCLETAAERVGGSVRGKGLLWALQLPRPFASTLAEQCYRHGLLVNAAQPNVLRFAPSLRVTAAEIRNMGDRLARAAAAATA